MLNFELFFVESIGSGGISEAASMGEQIRIFNVGVLGETALPGFWVCRVRAPAPRSCGTRTCLRVDFPRKAPTPAPTLIGAGRGKDTITRGFLLEWVWSIKFCSPSLPCYIGV